MRFPSNTIEYQLYKIASFRVNYKAKFENINYTKHNDFYYSISEIVNDILGIKEINIGVTLENSIREFINAEPAYRVCKDNICGRPDFIKDYIPGEIKSFAREVDPTFEKKGILQAALYAWLYGTRRASFVSAIYDIDSNGADYAIVKRIDFYNVIITKISIKKYLRMVVA
ncbi:hypothetical protein [Saccharolobus shibatae]|uniref:Uncharacterized protein n=1 Tax=Saccharolobus shibatae TaxID=2286 RepID=A0A8F5C180_9CREN|nr:hypothetical protein [Saccharolobus shibatae]QXJ35090.1 hypothetical protein J5U22_01637 [Saccharolobus shibatae]